jgi:hypothetical protein
MRHVVRRLSLFLPAVISLVGCGGDEPKPKAEAWIGKSFLFDTAILSTGNLEGIGANLVNLAPKLLIGVEAGPGEDLVITLSTAIEGSQDMCTPTTQVTASGADSPHSLITASTFPIRIVSKDPTYPGEVSTTVHDVSLKDILPGMESMATAQLDAIVDFAELYRLFWPDGTPEGYCSMASVVGMPCEVCPFNGEPFCRSVQAVGVVAQEAAIPTTKIASGSIPTSCLQRP